MDWETKSAPALPITPTDDATGSFKGYLAVFNNQDSNGDIIDPGAFTRTIHAAQQRQAQTHSRYLWPLLWQHDQNEPIGGILTAKQDSHGLYITGEYDLDTELGSRAYAGVKKGYLPGMSIGYQTVKAVYDNNRIRHLTEIKLLEGSVVTFPANAQALVTSVKAHRADATNTNVNHLLYETAVTILEAKAARIQRELGDDALAEQSKQRQEEWQSELHALHARRNLERSARARGERIPSVYSNPEAYAAWLQQQRMRPYIELARDLNEQSRREL